MLSIIRKYCDTFSTIIDVGANKGQFAIASKMFYPNTQIYSFEPIDKADYLAEEPAVAMSE